MKNAITFLLIFMLSTALPAQDKATAAAHRLANTKFFAFGGTGFAGKTSDGEKDFRIVFAQGRNVVLRQFEDLFASGNPEAKSYALVAIHALAPDRFRVLAKSLKGSSVKVVTMSGCIVEDKTIASVAEDIAKGSYDYWLKRH
jgi:hypothetical protein